jgi:hypothetical protein
MLVYYMQSFSYQKNGSSNQPHFYYFINALRSVIHVFWCGFGALKSFFVLDFCWIFFAFYPVNNSGYLLFLVMFTLFFLIFNKQFTIYKRLMRHFNIELSI